MRCRLRCERMYFFFHSENQFILRELFYKSNAFPSALFSRSNAQKQNEKKTTRSRRFDSFYCMCCLWCGSMRFNGANCWCLTLWVHPVYKKCEFFPQFQPFLYLFFLRRMSIGHGSPERLMVFCFVYIYICWCPFLSHWHKMGGRSLCVCVSVRAVFVFVTNDQHN